MSTAIQKAIEASTAATAARADVQQGNTSAQVIPHPSSAGVPMAPGKRLTMGEMQGNSISVDTWMKVKQYGIIIGDSGLIPSLRCSIEMRDGAFIPKYSIKAGNPAQYFSTLDQVTAVGGGSWAAACEKARALDGRAREYRCVELPFRLEEDAVFTDPKTKAKVVVAKAGDMIGHTTSTTNWANWEKFYTEVSDAGLLGQTVDVILTAQERKNKSGNEWGVLAFELVEPEGGE